MTVFPLVSMEGRGQTQNQLLILDEIVLDFIYRANKYAKYIKMKMFRAFGSNKFTKRWCGVSTKDCHCDELAGVKE